MSDELEKKIDKLEELVEKLANSSSAPASSSGLDLKKWLGPIITIMILAAGIVGTWAVNNYALAEMKRDLVNIVLVNEKQEEMIQDIKLKAAVESSDLKSVKEDVAEIKQDVKTLLKGR